jgi:hypothetical protein
MDDWHYDFKYSSRTLSSAMQDGVIYAVKRQVGPTLQLGTAPSEVLAIVSGRRVSSDDLPATAESPRTA